MVLNMSMYNFFLGIFRSDMLARMLDYFISNSISNCLRRFPHPLSTHLKLIVVSLVRTQKIIHFYGSKETIKRHYDLWCQNIWLHMYETITLFLHNILWKQEHILYRYVCVIWWCMYSLFCVIFSSKENFFYASRFL